MSDRPVATLRRLEPSPAARYVEQAEYQLTLTDPDLFWTIGRSETCHIVIRNELVGRLHARIEHNGQHYVLYDVDSANGTFVNGQLTKQRVLRRFDKIGFGLPSPMLEFDDPAGTTTRAGKLQLSPRGTSFTIADSPLKLTRQEFQLLLFLYQNQESICSKVDCILAVWPEERKFSEKDILAQKSTNLDNLVGRLREKFEAIEPVARLYIVTHDQHGVELTLILPWFEHHPSEPRCFLDNQVLALEPYEHCLLRALQLAPNKTLTTHESEQILEQELPATTRPSAIEIINGLKQRMGKVTPAAEGIIRIRRDAAIGTKSLPPGATRNDTYHLLV